MVKETKKTDSKFIETVGRRKTAVARVRLSESAKRSIVVNEKSVEDYFPTQTLKNRAIEPFNVSELPQGFTVIAKVTGGGIAAQAVAVRHGIARALVKHDLHLRKQLKVAGHLKRDPREKERRKFGLKKARKSAQWSKR